MSLVLHGYWRSAASYRVRIALNLKNLAFDYAPVELRKGEQRSAAYLALNPQGLAPALEVDGVVLTQSLAMLEWLEEAYPEPPLLPLHPLARAQVRAMCALIAADIHPLNNLRVLGALRSDLGADEAQVSAWISRWVGAGFDGLEGLIERQGGDWAWGDALTLADCCLIPQVYGAQRFGVDVSAWPRIAAINARALAHPAFAEAHPDRQPDAD
jgi:maleylpyruvate isomerase